MPSDTALIRSFFALYPDAEAHRKILDVLDELRGLHRNIRWEKPEQIHITLKFIAEIPRRDVLRIVEDLRPQLASIPPLKGTLDILGAFPNTRRPNVIWLGFSSVIPHLPELQQTTERQCERYGIPPERRRFTPHFTLGRVKDDRNGEDLYSTLQTLSFMSTPVVFRELRCMESVLSPQGAKHTVLAEIPFLTSG